MGGEPVPSVYDLGAEASAQRRFGRCLPESPPGALPTGIAPDVKPSEVVRAFPGPTRPPAGLQPAHDDGTDILALRAGLNEKEMTAGLGVALGDMSLDYAFSYHNAAADVDDLGSSHRMGLRVSFGRRVADQEASLRWQE